MTTKKKRPRKQTTQRVSRIAAKVMKSMGRGNPDFIVWDGLYDGDASIRVYDVMALAASCLSQDERKGR